ncbi:MAG TPA: glycine cleavage T C-terminal barrel domain-containing protein, partial [Verrucomicrobiae bacterium]|nr:glycine cleavage T C-terminal barrel domain-containing protein [Verrucomicrobiae bacterium]
LAEYAALHGAAGVIDLSFRSRICLAGADRARFLHGQVTNDIKRLGVGQGCYAALVTTKGKMESDLNVYALQDELLLDFEPGLTEKVSQRLEKFIVADDVQIVDVMPHYGLLSVQGLKAEAVVRAIGLFIEIPAKAFDSVKFSDATLGEIYLMNHARLNTSGFDLFVPINSLGAVADKLIFSARQTGGGVCGWQAFETARIEAGIPRFGADMDETNLPLECGIESRAVSYQKGCYIGQEVINRVHVMGQVTKELRGLRLEDGLAALPVKGDKLLQGDKEVGYVTSAVRSPVKGNIALGYVRREANAVGTELVLAGKSGVKVVSFGRV